MTRKKEVRNLVTAHLKHRKARRAAHIMLEKVREELRRTRGELIEAINCHGKDVLSPSDIASVLKALAVFLRKSSRLSEMLRKYAASEGMMGHLASIARH